MIRLSAESPRYIMQQAMYLPWRGVTLHHHRGWFEHGHGDLCHRKLLMVCLLRGDDWSIGGQHEVDARIWNQIGLEPAGSCCLRTNESFLERDPYMQNNFGAINKANPRHSVMSTFNAPSKPGHFFGCRPIHFLHQAFSIHSDIERKLKWPQPR